MSTPKNGPKFSFACTRVRPWMRRLLILLLTLLLAIRLLGCRPGTSDLVGSGETFTETQDHPHPAKHGVEFGGLLFLPDGDALLDQTADRLIVSGDALQDYGVFVPVDHLDSVHVFFEPQTIPVPGRFQTALLGRVEGSPRTLGSLTHYPQDDGSTLIELSVEDMIGVVGDSVSVIFLWNGEEQYRTTLPTSNRMPIAYYNSSAEAFAKLAEEDPPTSYYWAYVDGVLVLMADWEEGGGKRANPAFLIPAFPTPYEEIGPVDYLRLEFSIQAESVSPEAMVITANGVPSFTFTRVQY